MKDLLKNGLGHATPLVDELNRKIELKRLAEAGDLEALAQMLGRDPSSIEPAEVAKFVSEGTDAEAEIARHLPSEPGAGDAEEPKPAGIDWGAILTSNAFRMGLVLVAGITLLFWPLFKFLPGLWLSEDGYYSHGFLIPFISGYIIYKWWPKLKNIPVRPSWLALIPLAGVLWISTIAVRTSIDAIMSLSLLAMLMLGIAFTAGWRWMLALALPTLYLAFALPLWTMAINTYTNPLQVVSTKVAFFMLQIAGFEPLRDASTVIHLSNFTLDVGVPCSGLKLVLALTAFTFFFVLIANLKWWGNVIMVAFILPLAMFINGLRIMLIGVVGDMYGADAGHKFHDYSGYITLIVCFFIIFKLARLLGWKD